MGFPVVQDPEGAIRLEGVVTSFSYDSAWGFISCPEVSAQYNKDCFFHKKDCGGVDPRKGQKVSFVLMEEEGSGKPHAQSIIFETGRTQGQFKRDVGGPRYTGTVLSYTNQNGWGFIACPDAANGKDVFFHLKDIEGVYSVAKGDILTFCVDNSISGKPQASLIQLLGKTDTPGATRYEGIVTGFTPTTAWGFIDCPELKQIYQKDVFFHQKDCSGGEVWKGLKVSFLLDEENTEPGKPKATSILVPEGAPPSMMGHGSPRASQFQKGMGGLTPFGLGAAPALGGGMDFASASLAVVQATGAQLSGTIQSFADPPGWGFLECPGLGLQPGKGVFFHVKDCNGLGPNPQQGMPVTFTVSNGPSGRIQATNVQPGHGGGRMMKPQKQQLGQQLQQLHATAAGGAKRTPWVLAAPSKRARV